MAMAVVVTAVAAAMAVAAIWVAVAFTVVAAAIMAVAITAGECITHPAIRLHPATPMLLLVWLLRRMQVRRSAARAARLIRLSVRPMPRALCRACRDIRRAGTMPHKG